MMLHRRTGLDWRVGAARCRYRHSMPVGSLGYQVIGHRAHIHDDSFYDKFWLWTRRALFRLACEPISHRA